MQASKPSTDSISDDKLSADGQAVQSLPADAPQVPAKAAGKGKYITLAFLLAWVAFVLVLTMLKFKGFNR